MTAVNFSDATNGVKVLLTPEQVMEMMAMPCRGILARWCKTGAFPKPQRYGTGRGVLRWDRSVVEAFLVERAKGGQA